MRDCEGKNISRQILNAILKNNKNLNCGYGHGLIRLFLTYVFKQLCIIQEIISIRFTASINELSEIQPFQILFSTFE